AIGPVTVGAGTGCVSVAAALPGAVASTTLPAQIAAMAATPAKARGSTAHSLSPQLCGRQAWGRRVSLRRAWVGHTGSLRWEDRKADERKVMAAMDGREHT